jgi:Uncharacterised nucleotidyltransferase
MRSGGSRQLWLPLPTPPQLALLQLALAENFDADAFDRWSRSAGRALDEGSRRLLPILYPCLKASGMRHPWLQSIRQMHARALLRNRLLVHRAIELADRLARSGIPTLLLKGVALAPAYYGDLGRRPMSDIDLMVAPSASPRTMEDVVTADTAMRLRGRALHADTYLDREGIEYDIHRYLLPELAFDDAGRALWKRAEPLQFGRQTCLTLCPEDHVFHLLGHGLRVSDVPPLRWIADAAMVLRARPGFDWHILIEEAQATEMAVPVARGLSFLVEHEFAGAGAAEALRRLEAMPSRRADRYLFAGQMKPPGLLYSLLRPFLLYRRLRGLSPAAAKPGFSRFLADLWGLRARRSIPGAFLGKLVAKIRS